MAFRLVHQISCNIKNTGFIQNTSTRRFRSLSPAPRNPDGLSSKDHQPCELRRRRSLSCCKRDLLKTENVDALTTKRPLSYDCNQYGCEKYCDSRISSRNTHRSRDVSITSRYFSRVENTEWMEDEDEAATSFEPELLKKQKDAAALNKQARETLNQYRLRDSVPVKKKNVYDVYDYYMKDYVDKDMKVLPHLQPNRLQPYGKGQSMVFPYRSNKNRAITYPIMEPSCSKEVPTGYKPNPPTRTNVASADKQKREYSTKSDHDINNSTELEEIPKIGLSHKSLTYDMFRQQDNATEKNLENYSDSSKIEKCNQVINDFRKINPGCKRNKKELTPGSTELKKADATALNFVATYKQDHHNSDVDKVELQESSEAVDGKCKPSLKIKVAAKANLLQGSADPEALSIYEEEPPTNNVRLVSPWPSYAETCKPLHRLKTPLPILYPNIIQNQRGSSGPKGQSLKFSNSQPKLELSTRSLHRINSAQELSDSSRKDASLTNFILNMSTNSNGNQECFFQIPPNSTLYQPILNTPYRASSYQNIIKSYSKNSKILEDPPKATENFKNNDCPCVEQKPPVDVPPLKRLKKRIVYDDLPKICTTKEKCPPRADQNLVMKPKKLRPIIGSRSCKKVCAPMMDEGPPLPRLVKRDVREPKKECPKSPIECQPRADGNLRIKRKSLPSLTPKPCSRPERISLTDVSFQRLPKFNIPDPERFALPAEKCPPRADEKLKIKKKSLPKLRLSKCKLPKQQSFQDVNFKRLNKYILVDPPRKCHSKREVKITRADDGVKPRKRSLPNLAPQKCPRMEPEPLKDAMPLVSPRKRCLPEEPPRVCPGKERCPPRADDGLVFKPKKLPPIIPGICRSKEDTLQEGCPLPRLKKRRVVEPERVCLRFKDLCPPRSDAGLKVARRKLPLLERNKCPKGKPRCMTDAPTLRRLPRVEIEEAPKICPPAKECVDPRADDGMVIQSKKLPPLRRSSCPCIEGEPLKDVNFTRLKKFRIQDPPRVCAKPDECDESLRADAVAGYKFEPKELPPMILKAKNNRVSTRNFTKKKSSADVEVSPGRKFSTSSNIADEAVSDALKGTWKMLQDISSYTYNLMRNRYCSNLFNSEHTDKEQRSFVSNVDSDFKTGSSHCLFGPNQKLLETKACEANCNGILEPTQPLELSSKNAGTYLRSRSKSSPSLKDIQASTPKPDQDINNFSKLQPFSEKQESVTRKNNLLCLFNTHGFDHRVCGNSLAGTLKRDSRLLHVLANNAIDKVKPPTLLQKQNFSKTSSPEAKSVLKYFSSSYRGEDGLRSIATEYRPFLNPLYKNNFKLTPDDGIQVAHTNSNVKNSKLPVFPTSYKKYFHARYFSNPLYSNAFYPNRKAFNTSAALLKRKTSQTKNKAKCRKIKMPKCKARARQSCTPIVKHQKCTRSKSPYPAFSECGRPPKESPHCECHPLMDKKVLQPRYPIMGSVKIQKPPPPEHEPIDEEKEIRCIQEKLKKKEEGTKTCEDFAKREEEFKEKEVLAHAQCEVEEKVQKKEVNEKISSQDKQTPGKSGECPKIDIQTCHVKEIKLPPPKVEPCQSPKRPSMLCTEEKTQKRSDECSQEKSTKMYYMEQPCNRAPTKKGFLQRIIDYFKPRPNCPSPGEYKAKKLRANAEKAAKAAGLKVCTPCDPCKPKKSAAPSAGGGSHEISMEMPSLKIFSKVRKYSKKKPPGKGKKPAKPSTGGKGKGKGKPKGKGNKRASPPTLKGVSKVKRHSKFHQQMTQRKSVKEEKCNFSNMFPPDMPDCVKVEAESAPGKCTCNCPCSADCTCNCNQPRIPMEECMIQARSRRDPCERRKKRKSCSRSKSRKRRSRSRDDDDDDCRRKRKRRSRSKSRSCSRSKSRKRRSRSRSDDCRRRSKSRRRRSKSKSRSRSRSKSRKRRSRSKDECRRRSKSKKSRSKSKKSRSKSKKSRSKSKSRKSRSKSKKSPCRSKSKSKRKGSKSKTRKSSNGSPCKPKSKPCPPCKPRIKKNPCKPKPKKAPPCKSKLPTKKPQSKPKSGKSKLPTKKPQKTEAKKSSCKKKPSKPGKSKKSPPKPMVRPAKPKPKKKPCLPPKTKKKCMSEGDRKVCPSIKNDCPPRVRKSCDDEYQFKPCKPQIAPYPSFSECHPPFPKIKLNECTVARRRSSQMRSVFERNRRSRNDKRSGKEEKTKKDKRRYSTMSIVAKALGFHVPTCWRRSFSSNSNGRGPKYLPENLNKNEPTKVAKSNKALNQRLLAGIEEGIEKLEAQNTNLSSNSYYKILKTLQKFSEQEIAEFFEEEPQFNPFLPLKDNVHETISYVCSADPRAAQTNLLDPDRSFETRCLGIADINAQMEELKIIEAFRHFCNNLCSAQDPELDFEEKERRKTEQMRRHLDELLKNSKQP